MNVFSFTATKGCGARQTPSYTSLGCLCTAARRGPQLGEAKRENKIIPRMVPPRFSLRSQTEPRATGNDYQTWISSGKKFFHCSTSNLQEKFGKFASHSPGTSCDQHTSGRQSSARRSRTASEHKARLWLTGQRSWRLHKRFLQYVNHFRDLARFYSAFELVTSSDSAAPD